ncbi:hypothetical protein BSKO_01384 [Bryopsis sp. KO-2023]|nr:hypothetical protein BSKO_01384 [Bryopsis sp. KO-2023]
MAAEGGPSKKSSAKGGSGGTFTLMGEDYTLANSLRWILNRNPEVEFCGYSAPHPSEDLINMRIQTTGRITAKQALKKAALELRKVCEHVKEEYKSGVEAYGQASGQMDVKEESEDGSDENSDKDNDNNDDDDDDDDDMSD